MLVEPFQFCIFAISHIYDHNCKRTTSVGLVRALCHGIKAFLVYCFHEHGDIYDIHNIKKTV